MDCEKRLPSFCFWDTQHKHPTVDTSSAASLCRLFHLALFALRRRLVFFQPTLASWLAHLRTYSTRERLSQLQNTWAHCARSGPGRGGRGDAGGAAADLLQGAGRGSVAAGAAPPLPRGAAGQRVASAAANKQARPVAGSLYCVHSYLYINVNGLDRACEDEERASKKWGRPPEAAGGGRSLGSPAC